MKISHSIIALTAIATSPWQQLFAGPMGFADLRALANRADTIIVPTVKQQTQSGVIISLNLSVDRVLKGATKPGQLVFAQWSSPHGKEVSINGMQGLWLLQNSGNQGIWQVLTPVGGDVPLGFICVPASSSLPSDMQYTPGAPVPEKVVLEMLATIEARNGQNLGLIPSMLDLLDQTNDSVIRNVLNRWSVSTNLNLRAMGLSGRLRRGDPTALASVQVQLNSGSNNETITAILNDIRRFNNANPQAVVVLGELATSAGSSIRLQASAAEALRNMHSKETLPYLVRLLDSPDQFVRYNGISGLASFANSGTVVHEAPLIVDGIELKRAPSQFKTDETVRNYPTFEYYVKNEQQYLTFWKSWWSTNQLALSR